LRGGRRNSWRSVFFRHLRVEKRHSKTAMRLQNCYN
jgi:hypothetical protein